MKAKTLLEFVTGINTYLRNNPQHANLPVLTAADDEGNGFNRVFYNPAHGKWDTGSDETEGVCVS